MKVQKLLYTTQKFFKRNGSTILTVIGICGGVYAAVKAVKDTPKAMGLLAKAKEPDDYGTMHNYLEEKDFTTWDAVKTVVPVYILPVVVGVSSIACILGANVFSRRQQAALASAYALLDRSFKKYRDSAKRVYGEDADETIQHDIMIAEYAKLTNLPHGDLVLFYDSISDLYFYSTPQAVMEAELDLNRNLSIRGYANLNEFYNFLGIPETIEGDILGWDLYSGETTYGYKWIDFEHREQHFEDGTTCYAIITPFPPHLMFDGLDDETDQYNRVPITQMEKEVNAL